MSDRHPKWQRVEPGHVIPAGQPYRVEYTKDNYDPDKVEYKGRLSPFRLRDIHFEDADYYVDSSWRPPLVLPTEYTYGLLRLTDGQLIVGGGGLSPDGKWFACRRVDTIRDFIPLTEEQVQRIEAAR